MAKEYILADITTKIGDLNRTYIHDVTFIDPEDLTVYMCVVDESYRNYLRCHWDIIVTGDVPYGLYCGIKRATNRKDKDGFPIISADSKLQLIEPMSAHEVVRFVAIRKEQLGIE